MSIGSYHLAQQFSKQHLSMSNYSIKRIPMLYTYTRTKVQLMNCTFLSWIFGMLFNAFNAQTMQIYSKYSIECKTMSKLVLIFSLLWISDKQMSSLWYYLHAASTTNLNLYSISVLTLFQIPEKSEIIDHYTLYCYIA